MTKNFKNNGKNQAFSVQRSKWQSNNGSSSSSSSSTSDGPFNAGPSTLASRKWNSFKSKLASDDLLHLIEPAPVVPPVDGAPPPEPVTYLTCTETAYTGVVPNYDMMVTNVMTAYTTAVNAHYDAVIAAAVPPLPPFALAATNQSRHAELVGNPIKLADLESKFRQHEQEHFRLARTESLVTK